MTNFNQTGHKAFFGEGDSSLIKWRAQPFSKGRLLGNNKNTLMKFKNLLNNHWANYNQTCHSASSGEGYSSLFKWRTIQFSLSRYKFLLQHCDNHMSLWISYCLSFLIVGIKAYHTRGPCVGVSLWTFLFCIQPLNPNPDSNWGAFFKDNDMLLQIDKDCRWVLNQLTSVYQLFMKLFMIQSINTEFIT